MQQIIDHYDVVLYPNHRELISDLNNIPKEILASLQKVTDHYDKEVVLQYYMTRDNKSFLREFAQTVLNTDVDTSSWMRGRILAPTPSFRDILTISKDNLFKTDLQGLPNCIIIPNYDSWVSGENTTGMPGIFDENSTYRSPRVEGLTQYSLQAPYTVVKQKYFGACFQNWLASRMAFMLKHENKLDTFSSPEDLNKYAPLIEWTDDAQEAFNLLINHRRENPWSEGTIPGYTITFNND